MLTASNWGSIMQMAASMGSRDAVSIAHTHMLEADRREQADREKLKALLSGTGNAPVPPPKSTAPLPEAGHASAPPPESPIKIQLERYHEASQRYQERAIKTHREVMELTKKKGAPLEIHTYRVLEKVVERKAEQVDLCKDKLALVYYIASMGKEAEDYGLSTGKETEDELRRLQKELEEGRLALKNAKALIIKEIVEPLRRLEDGT